MDAMAHPGVPSVHTLSARVPMSWNPLRALPHPPRSGVAACLLLCLLLSPITARAEGSSEPPSPSASPEVPPAQPAPPVQAAPALDAPTQPPRRTGWDIQGVPAIN